MLRIINAVIIAIFLIINPLTVHSWQENQNSRIIMIIVDKLTLPDISIDVTPHLHMIATKGSCGLMNTNTGGLKTSPSCYLTLGTGTRSRAFFEGGLAFNGGEKHQGIDALSHYQIFTGYTVRDENTFHLYINLLNSWNSALTYEVVPGILGEQLKMAGIKSAVLGNGDLPDDLNRFAQMIAMDKEGQVAGIINESMVITDISQIPPWKTNYQEIYKNYLDRYFDTNFLVIETGNLYRLEKYQRLLKRNIYQSIRRELLSELDTFIGLLLNTIKDGDIILIISPSPSQDELSRGNGFAPVLIFPFTENSLLSSKTTHQRGIITNIDIPIFILEFFGVNPHISMHGGSIWAENFPHDNLEYLLNKQEGIIKSYSYRPLSIQVFIALQIIFLFLYFLCLFKKEPWNRLMFSLGYSILSVPLMLLFIPAGFFGNSYFYVLSWFVPLFLINYIIYKKLYPRDFIVITSTLTWLVIALDLILNLRLMENSVLGYCSIIGGRFYGIGNEYMGIFLGSFLVSNAYYHQFYIKKTPIKVISSLFYILIIYMFSHPLYGANLGGTLTIATALTVFFIKLTGGSLNKKSLIIIFLSIFILMNLILLLDFFRSSSIQSHMGKTVDLIRKSGINALAQIIIRKVQTNIKIFRWSIWSIIFLSTTSSLAYLVYSPRGKLKEFFEEYPYIYKCLISAIWGSAAAFIFNDSGVAPAATTFMFPFYTLLYLTAHKIK